MNIAETLKDSYKKLTTSTTPEIDAELLLSFVIKKPKEFLFTYPETEVSTVEQTKYAQLLIKRKKGMPLAYMTNSKGFYGLDFYVDENVLIPRPETELLVEETLKVLKKDSKLKTLTDIGTGSGAVAIAVKTNSDVEVRATDISKKALAVAKKNAKSNEVEIEFIEGNLLEPIKDIKTDVIVANLPYLDDTLRNSLKSSATMGLEYEPQKALYSGKDGLDDYRKFFQQVVTLEYKPKHILIEHDPRQTDELHEIIKTVFPAKKIEFKTVKDLAGFERVTCIQLISK